MRCPFCNYDESKVVDSRPTEDGESIRRRRECLSCGKRFNTYELIEHFPIVVVKKDGSRQSFDRNKVFNGMLKSCEKRPVAVETIENAAREIEAQILNSMQREVSSEYIGELVMDQLKDIDQVAYVRFASVYRQFQDIESFMDALNKLMDKR